MSRLVKMLEHLRSDAVMSKFVTVRECQAYRAAVEDMLYMLREVPPEERISECPNCGFTSDMVASSTPQVGGDGH